MKAWEIRETLRNSPAIVTFKKKNGEIRVMKCTLQDSVVPAVYGSAPPTDELITVWDLEQGGWRSIKTSSIISFESNLAQGANTHNG